MAHILNLEEFEKVYKFFDCRLYKMEVEYPSVYDDIKNLNVSDSTFKKWNEEYVLKDIDSFDKENIDSIHGIKRDVFIPVDYSITKKLFLNFKEILDIDSISTIDKLECLLDIHFSLYPGHQAPFSGFMGLAVYNNDFELLNEMREIYIHLLMESKGEDCIDSYKIFIIFSLAYDLDYKLDELNKKYAIKAKKAFQDDIEDGESLWPMVCYLTGIAVEENYRNAYRALKLTYDKYHEISDDFINYLSFINFIAKRNYTPDDVLKLESLEKRESMPELEEKIGLYPGEI